MPAFVAKVPAVSTAEMLSDAALDETPDMVTLLVELSANCTVREPGELAIKLVPKNVAAPMIVDI